MQRQSQICRKKSAFRNKIRQQHIQKMFKKCREQYQQQEANNYNSHHNNHTQNSYNNNNNIKEIDEFRICSASKKVQYPVQAVLYDGDHDDKTNCTFYSSHQVSQYIQKLLSKLPNSVHRMVSFLTNNPKLTPELCSQILPHNLSSLTAPFNQCSISQFTSYLYILECMLVQIEDLSSRRLLILQTKEKIITKTVNYLSHNKIIRNQILKSYFDYVVVLGDDVRLFNCIDIAVLVDFVREVFNSNQLLPELVDSVIVVCNNVVSLNSNHYSPNSTQAQQSQQYYNTELLKQSFIGSLLQNPKPLKQMLMCGIDCETNQQLQYILRFFINFTYVITKPQELYIFVDALVLLINAVLSQWKLLKKLSIINVLVLRLINNIAVSDVYSAQLLWKQRIIVRIVDVYGQWILDQCPHYRGNTSNEGRYAPQSHVYSEFISTISTYIILQNNHTQSESQFSDNIEELLDSKTIHLVLLQSLTLSYISHGQSQVMQKILEALVILCNYESLTRRQSLCLQIQQNLQHYYQLFDNLNENTREGNVGTLCEALMQIIDRNKGRKLQRERMEMEAQNQQARYQQIMSEIQMENKIGNNKE